MSGVTSETLRKLAALRLDPEQMAGVLELLADMQASDEKRKADQRARVAKHRANKQACNVTVTSPSRYPAPLNDPPASSGNVEVNLNTPPKEKDPKGSQKKAPPKWPDGSFDRIWDAYPHKVGKKAVYAKLLAIERSGEVTPDEILEGIAAYELCKPAHHDWKNPLTWLNQGCWADKYGPPADSTGPPSPVLPFRVNGSHFPNPSSRHAEHRKPSVHDAAQALGLFVRQNAAGSG